jgi:hypothetical protein
LTHPARLALHGYSEPSPRHLGAGSCCQCASFQATRPIHEASDIPKEVGNRDSSSPVLASEPLTTTSS